MLAADTPVRVGRHAFELLIALVERSGHLVTKDQLLERIWPKLVVEENTLQAHVSALRKILGTEAIATISGQGYRFTPEVTHVAANATTAPSATDRMHNLPHPLTSFIGREQVIVELKVLLGRTRSLTLTGAGGCGKTRLGVEVAAESVQGFADGVWLVELAALQDPGLVPKAVAIVLGVKEQAGKSLTQALTEAIAPKHMLVLLDNVEHVLGACALLVDSVLRACARIVILVTSRERLGIAGELTYRVPSLSVPDPKKDTTPEQISTFESARLFIERARLQRPHFALTNDNAPALASICHRLDGIPLAIELAAPRVRSMSVEELSKRLDQRFGLLTGGSRTALPRHRTLRSLIDWSYDLLSNAEKALLNRVSVFSGSWTFEAAEQVCIGADVEVAEVLDLLTSLVDKNLAFTKEDSGATRFGLLESVRHYARDQLRESGEEAHVQRLHFDSYLALGQVALTNFKGAGQQDWLARTETEHDNFRAALSWSLTPGGDAASGLRLAVMLGWFWAVRGHLAEGSNWFAKLLAAVPSEEASLVRARGLVGAAVIVSQQGDDAQAKTLYEAALSLYRELGDREGTGYALRSLANVVLAQGDFSSARALYEESLVIARELGDIHTVGGLLGAIGEVAGEQGDYPAARKLLEECLAVHRERGDRWTQAWTLARLGRVVHGVGDDPVARDLFRQALTIQQELGDQWGIAWFLEGMAPVALTLSGAGPAARIWGAAERLRNEIGAPMPAADRPRYDRQVAAARLAARDDATLDTAWREGGAMTLQQAMQYALDLDEATVG